MTTLVINLDIMHTCSWKIIHCDANNCKVDFNSREMRDEDNYDPVSIHFNDAVKEIYVSGIYNNTSSRIIVHYCCYYYCYLSV